MKTIPIEEIKIGDSAEVLKIISYDMVRAFAKISGDFNPIHLNENYASKSRYKKRIIHGLIATSLFSGLFGTKLPGEGCVYMSQNIVFKRPIYIGDSVTARVEVVAIDKKKKILLFSTRCLVKGKTMIDGESKISVL
jgi:3-hydroxybutyryl-CoA dehydratase